MAYAQTQPSLNVHVDVSNVVRDLDLSLDFHLHPYFVYVSNEGAGEPAHMRRLALALVPRQCDKYQNIIN